MNYTDQQKAIIDCTTDMKINAVAGSGKTTTLIAFAKARTNSKILYLCFNRAIKIEVEEQLKRHSISNVEVKTTHSLAFPVVRRNRWILSKINGYQREIELMKLLHFKSEFSFKGSTKEEKAEARRLHMMVFQYVLRLFACFCNSSLNKISEVKIDTFIQDMDEISFVKQHEAHIYGYAELLFKSMSSGDIEIDHDFYLKKYQLCKPILENYEYILFDEAQDASEAILDVLLYQKGKKIIVGDEHQQIYSFRYAVNAMHKIDFPEYTLTDSFRFPQEIADFAQRILSYKRPYSEYSLPRSIHGKGLGKAIKSTAILARSNMALFKNVFINFSERKIYIEGGNKGAVLRTSKGFSLYDIFYLWKERHSNIRNDFIKELESFEQLKKYAQEAKDSELSVLIHLVEDKKDKTIETALALQECIVDRKEHADVIFSTVHKAKGLEYDQVFLEGDFVTQEKVNSLRVQPQLTPNVMEEVNILYVAATRATSELFISKSVYPVDFIENSRVKKW